MERNPLHQCFNPKSNAYVGEHVKEMKEEEKEMRTKPQNRGIKCIAPATPATPPPLALSTYDAPHAPAPSSDSGSIGKGAPRILELGVCRRLQVFAGVCRCLQVFAGVCGCLRVFAGVQRHSLHVFYLCEIA
jgi:hypothetical protein